MCKKFLITGGAGFIGSPVIRHIINNTTFSVVNVDKLTYAKDLAKVILVIIESLVSKESLIKTQIYHFSNDDQCSWYDFVNELIKLAKIECYINPITTKQYMSLAKRPKNTTMSKRKINKEFSLHIRHWKTSLSNCMNNL